MAIILEVSCILLMLSSLCFGISSLFSTEDTGKMRVSILLEISSLFVFLVKILLYG